MAISSRQFEQIKTNCFELHKCGLAVQALTWLHSELKTEKKQLAVQALVWRGFELKFLFPLKGEELKLTVRPRLGVNGGEIEL
jgi:hypothetical protein